MQLIEHYLSIQGEGLHGGKPAYFLRFARCNLRCSWCDSAYTFGKGKKVGFKAVAGAIRKSRAAFVCLTGGEPLLHKEDCLALIRAFPGLHFDIETGGSLNIAPFQFPNSSIVMDWKLKHSRMAHRMNAENLPLLRKDFDLLKLVTDCSNVELKEMRKVIEKTERFGFPISLQPVYGTDPAKLADWALALRNPRIQVNLQLHKIIWPFAQKGV